MGGPILIESFVYEKNDQSVLRYFIMIQNQRYQRYEISIENFILSRFEF